MKMLVYVLVLLSRLFMLLLSLNVCKLSGQFSHSTPHSRSHLSNEEMASMLRSNDFMVKNFSDTPPVAIIGDVAFYAEDLIPDQMGLGLERTTNIQKTRLWIDSAGRQQVWYYYDTQTKANHKVFESAVQTWAASTCIKFQKMTSGQCSEDRGHGAICVGAFGEMCFSHVGNSYGGPDNKHSQRMSVAMDGCEESAAAHEFGHALGLHHQQSRPDVNQFLFVNYHNIDIKLSGLIDADVRSKWIQAGKCNKEQVVDLPVPYDYLSLMQYGSSDFAEEDARMVYTARDVRHQYMLNYHRSAGMLQTHYDSFMVNTAYKCIDLWKKRCLSVGKPPPVCKNNGYVNEKCVCACPPGYSSPNCGSHSESIYPVQDRAKTMLHIRYEQMLDLSDQEMHLNNNGYIRDTFVYYQYITVIIDAGHPRARAAIAVNPPFSQASWLMEEDGVQSFFLKNIDRADCERGMQIYWGDASINKMRTECMSSVINNELDYNWLSLRGWSRHLDISAEASIGEPLHSKLLSMQVLEMVLDVRFSVNPKHQLRCFKTRADDPGPLTNPVHHHQQRKRMKRIILIALVIANLVVLIIGLLCCWLVWRTYKSNKTPRQHSHRHGPSKHLDSGQNHTSHSMRSR